MKILLNKYLISIFFVLGVLCSQSSIYNFVSLNSFISIGNDSNPLRLSKNEISDIADRPYLLGKASTVESQFFQYNFSLKFFSKKGLLSRLFYNKKTIFDLSFSDKTHFSNKSKSGYNINFKIDQQLGNYRHLYFSYFIMPSFYLREYEDLDYVVGLDDMHYNAYRSAYFDIQKMRLSYGSYDYNKVSKMKFGISYERQLFDKYFTEFDLNISGFFAQINFNHNDKQIMFYFSHEDANNFRYLDGSFSTINADRSFTQSRIKFSYKEPFNKSLNKLIEKNPFLKDTNRGIIVDSYYRYSTSDIESDKLHYKRSHHDLTMTYWSKVGNHKISVSKRIRTTSSPESWVEELKTFKRYILTYTFYFDKIRL